MIDYLIRAESWAVWQTYAKDWGWLTEFEDKLIPTPGTLIDEIGPVVLEPAVLGEDMTIEVPAVMDDWHHVNVRVLEPDLENPTGFMGKSARAVDVRGVDAVEKGVEPTRIQLLSAADIATPVRVWADGMHHPVPEAEPESAKAKAKKGKRT